MTTGEGGMLVTDNDEWAAAARLLRSHGVERQTFDGLGADDHPGFSERGPWYYEMRDLGYNYRLTDIQCALGLTQLARLPAMVQRRREIVARYNEAFSDLGWLTAPGLRNPSDREEISWHLYTLQVDFPALGKTRTEVMRELREKGVGSQVLYIPVHLQPWYRQTYGYAHGKCPIAEEYYLSTLSLPLYPAMTDADVDRVIAAVRALGA
jgi:dTDP-4-amino-4,6-dideoxygalactose transaminase